MTADWIEQTPDTLRLVARSMDMSKGQRIFRFGDAADAVYRILDGEVCLTRFSPEGA